MENTETQVWLDFSLSSEYISVEAHQKLTEKSEEFGKLLSFIIQNPEKFVKH
jgi:hypothetical protein